MSHLLEVRKTVIDQNRELACSWLSHLIQKREDLVLSIVGKDNENKLETFTDIFKSDPENPNVKALDKIVADLSQAEAKYCELEYRSLVYRKPVSDEIKLDSDNTEHEKYILDTLIKEFELKIEKKEEAEGVKEFFRKVFGVRIPSSKIVRSLTAIGCLSFIDECNRVLGVISQIESNNLMSDNNEHTTSIDSCVKNVQKLGIHITRSEFISVINSNVWSTDHENGYDKLVTIDLDQAKESTNQMGE